MVMTQCHDGITAGHVGRDATIKAAQQHYWWPNMTAWIADYVASCPVCARYKAPCHRPYGLLQPLATPDRPWGSISLDFIEGLPPSKKYDSKTYDSILVIVDRLTKFAILAPTHKTVTAKQTAVLLNRRNWKTRRPTPKLDTQFAGPYPVQERVGHRAYRITLPANLRVHDVFHVSMLKPARTSSLPQCAEQPTIPSLPDEDLNFEVEALIDKCSHNGTTEYKVLWRGYSEEAASWEPVENLNCPDLIQEYEVSEGGRASRQNRERRRKEDDVERRRKDDVVEEGEEEEESA
ncbi:uncharacterized protein UHO2_04327 [Ustilago hordei]|uniref:uncharacterized protein n=1 Tax=Ustilago hordei TaxID=120017 RepID=UPI001A5A36F5|nr:uncharacterized protein UHO2_04327 [Ustilago hordei]SYW79684.1 uncharacterized protein UHO2_04327 [Ustilago hordei]